MPDWDYIITYIGICSKHCTVLILVKSVVSWLPGKSKIHTHTHTHTHARARASAYKTDSEKLKNGKRKRKQQWPINKADLITKFKKPFLIFVNALDLEAV